MIRVLLLGIFAIGALCGLSACGVAPATGVAVYEPTPTYVADPTVQDVSDPASPYYDPASPDYDPAYDPSSPYYNPRIAG